MLLLFVGKVYSDGRADYGRLGLGYNIEEKSEPTIVNKIKDEKCKDIAAGQAVSYALMEDGKLSFKPVLMANVQYKNCTCSFEIYKIKS